MDKGDRHTRSEKGILAIRFLGASGPHVASNIANRGQHLKDTACPGLRGDGSGNASKQSNIPGCGQSDSLGITGAVHADTPVQSFAVNQDGDSQPCFIEHEFLELVGKAGAVLSREVLKRRAKVSQAVREQGTGLLRIKIAALLVFAVVHERFFKGGLQLRCFFLKVHALHQIFHARFNGSMILKI